MKFILTDLNRTKYTTPNYLLKSNAIEVNMVYRKFGYV